MAIELLITTDFKINEVNSGYGVSAQKLATWLSELPAHASITAQTRREEGGLGLMLIASWKEKR